MSDVDWMKKPKPRVNYNMLTADNRFNNQLVTVLGRVATGGIDPSGQKIILETSDHQQVVVRFSKPLNEPVTGFFEATGVSKNGGRELECYSYTTFAESLASKFDLDFYNRAIEIFNKQFQIEETPIF